MLIILLAMLICLLVPLLPLLFVRRMSPRPAPPLSEQELQRLAVEQRPAPAPREPDVILLDVRQEVTRRLQEKGRTSDGARQSAAPEGSGMVPAESANSGLVRDDPTSRLSLRKTYQWINVVLLPVYLILFLGLAALWSAAFHFLAEARAQSLPPAVFLFKPMYGITFMVHGIFPGIVTAAILDAWLKRAVLGKRYTEYGHWEQARFGLQGKEGVRAVTRISAFLGLLWGIPTALSVPFLMNWHARLTDEGVAIRRLVSVADRVYPYERVSGVVLFDRLLTKDGQIVDRRVLSIRFDDGESWTCDGIFHLPASVEEQERLLAFLREKTGKPIKRAPLYVERKGQ